MHQRLSELDMDNMLEKTIYGAGFINWVDTLCILLKGTMSINRMASGLWRQDLGLGAASWVKESLGKGFLLVLINKKIFRSY